MTAGIDAGHDQLAREHKRLTSEAAMPELPDLQDLSSDDTRALTEMVVDKIVVAPHPHKIVDGRRHYTIRAIPYQDPQQEVERLKAEHDAGQDRPQGLSNINPWLPGRLGGPAVMVRGGSCAVWR